MSDLNLIHCSYHKCLTVFYQRVMKGLLNRRLRWSRGYRHYYSDLHAFYDNFAQHRVASVNNRALDLTRLGAFRISRFVRDPRDLVVSGYFYHKRSAELWVRTRAPTDAGWYFANGHVPQGLAGQDTSFAEYLRSLTLEEGLLAELEFRKHHFRSMAEWPQQHPQIRTYRYEDIVGNEVEVMRDLLQFYEMSLLERTLGKRLAARYSIDRLRSDAHVRNPAVGQWRKHFTPRVKRVFDAQYAGLVATLGYGAD